MYRNFVVQLAVLKVVFVPSILAVRQFLLESGFPAFQIAPLTNLLTAHQPYAEVQSRSVPDVQNCPGVMLSSDFAFALDYYY